MNLSERDFAEVRAHVLARIEKRQKQRAWATMAAVTFAMLSLVIVLLPHKTNEHAVPHHVAWTSVSVPVPRVAITPPPVARTEAPAIPDKQASVRPVVRKRRHAVNAHHESIAQAASAEPMTIELHTSDPNIRIIWIAR